MNDHLFPFTLTREIEDIRIGILTIKEKSQGFDITQLKNPWDIFLLNDKALREDFEVITLHRSSQPIPASVQTINPKNIFIELGAKLSHCIINAESGPVYIGKNTEIMEGVLIRGPFALCEGSVIKMGATIYGATTIGPYCVIGGEIKNSVLFGYSNKAHEGYLGDSVIGEWCNLGAGTSNSNVKNTAASIKVWNNTQKDFINTGLIKCGLLMGDYSRAAINTSFNTGTVVGVCANVFGEVLSPKYIPGFSWGTVKYEFDKAIKDIGNWKKLKGHNITEQEKTQLRLIFDKI
jgi:UDP-N-acetylglucosamine diphosphorylase / glucose-1-phosphate thymidylyltransferase / UDP-N-acetylgalactosamine diphosphorylase / glucosamine-1-phosphate N-acetyltransferase / galactosamine-1-phosphate N-acetyltransferase